MSGAITLVTGGAAQASCLTCGLGAGSSLGRTEDISPRNASKSNSGAASLAEGLPLGAIVSHCNCSLIVLTYFLTVREPDKSTVASRPHWLRILCERQPAGTVGSDFCCSGQPQWTLTTSAGL